ncbi:MAG: DUF1846 domain-containing protein [Lentisphaerae bacterium]|nr:DUF1846 domain-containing protein [Lentisphaerota bacterium]
MSRRIGFDNEQYLEEQSSFIIDRARQFGNKLYIEFGGKLIFDYHAARILPGFDPNVKVRLLQRLKQESEIIVCLYAGDIARKKIRADFGITYDVDTLRLIDDLRSRGLEVRSVVVTRFEEQSSVRQFIDRLERRGVKVYKHGLTKGYPTNVDLIVSEEGYGANEFIETEKPIVIVTAPGPGSGKLGTCLSQLYHEHKRGIEVGYAKFETFPIWNIPLKHPVNVAYESATADLGDCNEVDPYHLAAYGVTSINYNRDVEVFPVVKRILERIMGSVSVYKSPTDMGVNRAGFAICDDEVVREAAIQEIIRRYCRYSCEYAMGLADEKTVERSQLLMEEMGASVMDRKVVGAAREAAIRAEGRGKGNEGVFCGVAIELADGTIISGENSTLMHAASCVVLNAIKKLAGIPDKIHLLPPNIIEAVSNLKKSVLKSKQLSLDLEETLIALSISATSNTVAQLAMAELTNLRGCEMHITHIPTSGDEAGLRRLGVNLTSDPNFAGKNLFMG